jgi:hypothetical protein
MGSSGGIPGIPGFTSGFFPSGPTMSQGSFMPWDMGALMQGSGMAGAQQAGAPQPPQSVPMGVLQAMAAPRQQPAQQPAGYRPAGRGSLQGDYKRYGSR